MFFWKRLFQDLVLMGLGRGLNILVALVSLGFLTRALGQGGFGEFSLALAFMFFFSSLADLGLRPILGRSLGEAPEKKGELWVSNFLSLRLAALGVFLGLGSALVWLMPYPAIVKIGALLAGGHFLFLSLAQVLMAIFQQQLKARLGQAAELAGRLVQLGAVIGVAISGGGVLWFLGAYVLGALVNFLVLAGLAWRWIKWRFQVNLKLWSEILKESLPLGLALLASALYFRLDVLLIGLFQPPSALAASSENAVGLYNLGFKVLEGLIFLPAAFSGLLLPELSKRLKKQGLAAFQRLFSKSTLWLLVGGVVGLAGLLGVAKPLILLLGGEEFLRAAPALQILSGAWFFIILGSFFSETLIALRQTKKLAGIFGGGLVFNLAANLVFIPKLSYLGAAWTTLATEALIAGLLFFILKQNGIYFSFRSGQTRNKIEPKKRLRRHQVSRKFKKDEFDL